MAARRLEDRSPAPTIWILSELYHPEVTSTGHFMTGIAEALAAEHRVGALSCQPTYASRGARAPWDERLNGVEIHRCWSTTLSRESTLPRLLNVASITLSIAAAGLRRVKRDDVIIAVTNPPLLPSAAALISRVRGARLVLKVDDVYPDIMSATGMLSSQSLVYRALERSSKRAFCASERICVLGRDMAKRVGRYLPDGHERIQIIPNWADVDEVAPIPRKAHPLLEKLGLSERFVILIAGNMGRPQDFEVVLSAAQRLLMEPEVSFLVIGDGYRRPWFREQVAARKVRNVTVLDPRPRAEQSSFLGACDVALSALVPGMGGVSVPSRLYSHLAAGRPVLVVGDRDCEAGKTVVEGNIGWHIEAGDVEGLVAAVLAARGQPSMCAEMGARARAIAVRRFSRSVVLQHYHRLVSELLDHAA